MGQILHKRAKTTHAIRTELQRSKATITELSKRYNLNPKTVLKWKHRETIEDSPMGAKRVRTVLSELDEVMICTFRQKTQLPLDDCYIALKKHIPALSRSNLHRCLKRFGLSRLPKKEKKPEKKAFKKYDIGYFHIDICEAHTGEGKAYIYVAVDRTCKYTYAEIHPSPTANAAADFLKNLIFAVPYKIHKILTDNGIQFSYSLLKFPPKGKLHCFDQICQEYQIEHRLTQIKHPWTNGQVERMNRTIKQATVRRYHYDTIERLKQHLYDFLNAYNVAQQLKTLKFLTPIQKILAEFQEKPHLFHSNPNHYSMGLNS
jgi:IS30 family transposase